MGELFPLRPVQVKALDMMRGSIRSGKKRPQLQLPTGAGKCLGRGTPVLMFDGMVRPVEDIAVGDALIGPDSEPRRVLSISRGREEMYRVTPIKGEAFVVNESHILSLKLTPGCNGETPNPGRRGGWKGGKVVNLSVQEYLASSKTFRHVAKAWRSAANFKASREPLSIEPYWLGLWLGDGNERGPSITTGDREVADAVRKYAEKLNLSVRKEPNSANSVILHITSGRQERDNPLRRALSRYRLIKNKHIPLRYKSASRFERLELLAGIMDADGHLANGGFEFTLKDEQLFDDVLFLARSLGFSAYKKALKKSCQTGATGTYFRCTINGAVDLIPCRVPRKRAGQRRQKKDVLITGIKSVEGIGEGDYFGFEIDGDRLFMLGDFTVTHNTVIAAHMATSAKAKGNRSAFTVPLLSLIDQTVERFVENGIDLGDIGVVQADHPLRRPHAPIQICSVQTLAKREFPAVDFIMVDESHLQYKIVYQWQDECPRKVFVGFSATPWAVGMANHYDELLVPATIKDMIASGDLCGFKAFAPSKPDLSGIKLVGGDYHEGQLSERMRDKVLTADIVETWLTKAEGRPTMLFAVDRAHAAKLHDQFCAMGVKSAYVDAFTERDERAAVKNLFHKGEIKVVCSIGCMTHGVDWDVRCVVFARPTKSPILYVQAIGRGLRPAEGKDHLLLLDHSNATLELGLPTEIHFSALLGGKKREGGGAKPARKLPSPRECPECGEIVAATERHCRCGHTFRFWSRIETEDGELQEIGAGKSQARLNREWTMEAKARFFGELKFYGTTHGYKRAWLVHKYVERFGVKPWPVWNAPPVQPSYETLAWVRSRQIAFARRNEGVR